MDYTLVADSSRGERVVDHGREFDPEITIPNGGWNAPLTDLAGFRSFLVFNPGTRATVMGVVNTTNETRPEESGGAFQTAVTAAQQLLR
jgi:hypothetical protein